MSITNYIFSISSPSGRETGSSQCIGTKTTWSHQRQFHISQRFRTIAARWKRGELSCCLRIWIYIFAKTITLAGKPSTNTAKSRRIHSVDATKKSIAPTKHWRFTTPKQHTGNGKWVIEIIVIHYYFKNAFSAHSTTIGKAAWSFFG